MGKILVACTIFFVINNTYAQSINVFDDIVSITAQVSKKTDMLQMSISINNISGKNLFLPNFSDTIYEANMFSDTAYIYWGIGAWRYLGGNPASEFSLKKIPPDSNIQYKLNMFMNRELNNIIIYIKFDYTLERHKSVQYITFKEYSMNNKTLNFYATLPLIKVETDE